jgi:hypothetical protein
VLFIDVENQEATYDLTVYYTDEELADFDDASALKILLVDGQVINDADPEKEITNTMVMLQIQKMHLCL